MKYSIYLGASLLLAGAAELQEVKPTDLRLFSCVRQELVDEPQIARVNFCHASHRVGGVELLMSPGFGLPIESIHKEAVSLIADDVAHESLQVRTKSWELNFKLNELDHEEGMLTLVPLEKMAGETLANQAGLSFKCFIKAVDRCSI